PAHRPSTPRREHALQRLALLAMDMRPHEPCRRENERDLENAPPPTVKVVVTSEFGHRVQLCLGVFGH
ncbi:hypothetical protein AAHH80_35665, partial [Burkholderia pseudomallei]